MKRCTLFLFSVSLLPAAEDALGRMWNEKLTYAQRNDACFELHNNRSPAVIAALRRALANEQLRACAARQLRETGAVEELKSALADPDADVRVAAVRELGAMRRLEFAPALARMALDAHALVAVNAVNALGQIEDRAATPYLLEIAGKGNMAGVAAFGQASRFGDPALLPIARKHLKAGDVAARVIAVRVVGEMGDASDIPLLREMAAKAEPLTQRGRGFGLMPTIDLARVAQNALERIEARTSPR